MNYFEGCKTAQEVKNVFKILVKKHHPDLGGDLETMKEVNAQFHDALKGCKLSGFEKKEENAEVKEYPYIYAQELEEMLALKVIDLLILANKADIQVSLLGSWIWVEGDTRPVKEELKALGLTWNKVRSCWCLNGTGRRSFKSVDSLEQLKDRFHAVTVKRTYALAGAC